ncbi:MAG: hypothetical protein H6553_07590 [Chitinophagales bacterium]|nr:hypothetical protein [Chitinophagales bacterium]
MKYFLSMLFVLAGIALKAQDKLVDFNSNTTLVKVIEITDNQIVYKKYDNLDGPTYKENKSLYSTIIFENGSVEVLNKTPITYKKDKSHRPRFTLIDSFRYNTLELDFLSFYTADVFVQYTRFLKKQNMAITIPFRAGWISNYYNGIYMNNSYYYNDRRASGYKFLTGANFKFFWRDKYKVRGYAGPELVAGYFNRSIKQYVSYYDNYGNYLGYSESYFRYKNGVLGLMGTIGLLAQPNKLISLKLELAGGFVGFLGKKDFTISDGYYNYDYYYPYNITGIGRMTFSLGFNF